MPPRCEKTHQTVETERAREALGRVNSVPDGGSVDEVPRFEANVSDSLYSGGAMPHRETPPRLCSKSSCQAIAAATLTYVYEDQEAVIGPLAIRKEPHTYDLCDAHAQRLSAPVGWRVSRYSPYPEVI